jgi:hypothetical protein
MVWSEEEWCNDLPLHRQLTYHTAWFPKECRKRNSNQQNGAKCCVQPHKTPFHLYYGRHAPICVSLKRHNGNRLVPLLLRPLNEQRIFLR